jgi:glutamate-1-semialdehyde 2,1-aminomutase
MGVVLPARGYLEAARRITKKYGSLLIFDEVITGFRVHAGGAQKKFGVTPDLTCLGKIMGGGLPAAAFGGRREVMDCLAPAGPVYQAGTLPVNPLEMAAGLWMMNEMKKTALRASLEKKSALFLKDLQGVIDASNYPLRLNVQGSMFTLFFTAAPVLDYAGAKTSDTKAYARYFHACLKRGLYLAPSQFEANFISTAHSEAHLKTALGIFRAALSETFGKS